jgi:hypothetical protein
MKQNNNKSLSLESLGEIVESIIEQHLVGLTYADASYIVNSLLSQRVKERQGKLIIV